MHRVDLKHVHRVKRKLANGTWREHHYAWRGGPRFWSDDMPFAKHSTEYLRAFTACFKQDGANQELTAAVVDNFLSSAEFRKVGKRTQKDYKLWALRFQAEFGQDPIAMFEASSSRSELNIWRQNWAHSPKMFDYAGVIAVRILNWAVDNSSLKQHFCQKLIKVYEVDRADIIWKNEDIDEFCTEAPNWVQRVLICACETGLRPSDLVSLNRGHIENFLGGRRIRIRTNKRSKIATIPVTQRLGKILDSTPKDRMLFLVGDRGQALTAESASKAVSRWRDRNDKLQVGAKGYDLRLYDARGTAATRLLNAGLGLRDIAVHMGWSLRYASTVIEHYAVVTPDESARVLEQLEAARKVKK